MLSYSLWGKHKLLTKWTWIYRQWFFKFGSEILLLLQTRHRRFAHSKGWDAKGDGSCASIGKRSMLSGNRGDFFLKYTVDRGSRVLPVVAMCGWLVYEIVEAPDGVVGGTLETEAVLPCLGALKKWMGLATPARQPLHPAFSESFVCPPRISSISYSPISRPIPLLCRRRLPGAAIRFVWHLRLTVDFFKIQRSAWRAQETERRQPAVRAAKPNVRRDEPWGTLVTSGCFPFGRSRLIDFVSSASVLCAISRRLGGYRERGSSRLTTSAWLSRLLHGRAGPIRLDTGKRVVLRVNRDIYFASSPPLWLRPFSHLLRRFRRTCRVCVWRVAHTFTGAYTRIRWVQREPTQLRHNPPVFALAWHGTASLFGHFRPGQTPPTFILITSWFAPGFCSPSFFPSERFPTADAWEPHLCPLAYSCPGPCDADLDISFLFLCFSLSSPSHCRSRGIRRRCFTTWRCKADGDIHVAVRG